MTKDVTLEEGEDMEEGMNNLLRLFEKGGDDEGTDKAIVETVRSLDNLDDTFILLKHSRLSKSQVKSVIRLATLYELTGIPAFRIQMKHILLASLSKDMKGITSKVDLIRGLRMGIEGLVNTSSDVVKKIGGRS